LTVLKRQKRILLALGWYDYRLHEGIAKFAFERGWHLCPDATKEKVIPWGWEGDGILAWLGAGEDLAEFVLHAGKPTVDFSYRRSHLPFPRVLSDHPGVARVVAEHYLSRGFVNYVFYSEVQNWAFEENGKEFVRLIEEAGHTCTWLCWQRAPQFTQGQLPWKAKRKWLTEALKRAPKPLAVFAATDDHALEVLESCENAGLSVPDQVSIIGSDNSLPAVESMATPISSVDLNLEELGYRGAALLNDLMCGKPPPKEPLRVPIKGLVARKSSDLVAVNHGGVAKGLRYMLDHYGEQIGIEELSRAAAMSRRGFHQAFLQHIGRPPGHQLTMIRVERAKQLLRETDLKMDAIGEQCGYQSANSFWFAFRQATGLSPKEYRLKQASAKQEGAITAGRGSRT
jgi:LacI family transcriptional regulator